MPSPQAMMEDCNVGLRQRVVEEGTTITKGGMTIQ